MRFDPKLYKDAVVVSLQSRMGIPANQAEQLAELALDVLCDTHGGADHYIPVRFVDKDQIEELYKGGMSLPEISQSRGITVRYVRKIIFGR